jgi:hypothetical protein
VLRTFAPEREEKIAFLVASYFVLFTKYYYSDKIKEAVMRGACSMHRTYEICTQI